jgi:hypothetical protein
VLNELIGCLDIGDQKIDTFPRFKSVMALSQTIQNLITPPTKWIQRDSFVVPAKDFLFTMYKMKVHVRISDILIAIAMHHPLAADLTSMLMVPLEILVRKGQPATTDSSQYLALFEGSKLQTEVLPNNFTDVALLASGSGSGSSTAARAGHEAHPADGDDTAPSAVTEPATFPSSGARTGLVLIELVLFDRINQCITHYPVESNSNNNGERATDQQVRYGLVSVY